MDSTYPIRREWAMQSKDTFDCKPIGDFVKKYLEKSISSIDPFSRNKRWATYTNDLNPETLAEYHCEARDFLKTLITKEIVVDLVILDPPYSQVQVSRSYGMVGREYHPFGDDNNTTLYKETKNLLAKLLSPTGIALTFGWNSVGFGKKRGFKIIEILMVCHGGAHNDTICVAEQRTINQQNQLL